MCGSVGSIDAAIDGGGERPRTCRGRDVFVADRRQLDVEGLLRWRCIGPFRGGRVVAVGGSSQEPHTYYFGAVAGGVWKTADGGLYWQPVSDGFFTTSSVGALAVAPSDPNVVYAGTGE